MKALYRDATTGLISEGLLVVGDISGAAPLANPTFTGTAVIPILTNSTSMTTPSIAINGAAAITGRSGTGGTVVMTAAPTIASPVITGVAEFRDNAYFDNATTATNATQLNSTPLVFQAQYWNGSASAADAWSLYVQEYANGAPGNGATTLLIAHSSGSSGAKLISLGSDTTVTGTFNATVGYQANGVAGVTHAAGAPTSLTTALGLVTAFSTSDERLKKAIVPFTRGLKELLNVKPISWYWKDAQTSYPWSGFSAQQVAETIPEASPEMPNGMLDFHYQCVLAVAVNAIKELKAIIGKLETRVAELENKNWGMSNGR